jgi:hypothetical protein
MRLILYDHSFAGITRRINQKLDQAHCGTKFGQMLGINRRLEIPKSSAKHCLLFGDVSMGNFFFDGNRIGAIDFEDVGFGPQIRDYEVLRYWLNRTFANFYYRTDHQLLKTIPRTIGVEAGVIRFDLHLLAYEQLVHSRSLKSAIDRVKQRRVLWKILQDITGFE